MSVPSKLVLKTADSPSKDRKFIVSNRVYLNPDDYAALFPTIAASHVEGFVPTYIVVRDFLYVAE